MYPDWVVFGALGFLTVWLLFISFLVWKQYKFLRSLFPKSGERDIRKKFEEVTAAVGGFRNNLSDFEQKIEKINLAGLKHIQKVGIVRFNPYDDTGGNISFAACFLDHSGSGIVITSLHARSSTRVFGKEIFFGKSKNQELSKEEQLVIKKAMEGI